MNNTRDTQHFIEQCKAIEPGLFIEETFGQTVENVSNFNRQIEGILRPRSVEQVTQIVRLANRFSIPLYPISTGFNWGFGSSAPVKSGGFILHLGQLNKIRQVNEDFGYVVIEPGVTQRQLSEHLRSAHSNFYLDVTGSSAETSIIGNALDRGISYHSHRCEAIINMEVILPNGDLIKTGFQSWGETSVNGLYKYAPGPHWDSLFFQSNFGIVVAVTYQLRPQPQQLFLFNLGFQVEQMPAVIKEFRTLKNQLAWEGLIHIANRERIKLSLEPLNNLNPTSFLDKLACKLIPSLLGKHDWVAVGSVMGPPSVVKAYREEIERRLKPHGHLKWYKPSFLDSAIQWAGKLKMKAFKTFLECISSVTKLNVGIPTDVTIANFSKNAPTTPLDGALKVDRSSTGFIYCVAMAPLTGLDANQMLKTIDAVSKRWSFKSEVTLNCIGKNILESVISLTFDRKDRKASERARLCVRELHQELIAAGCPPYRINIDMMDLIPRSLVQTKLGFAIKNLLDPKNIIAPGRYLSESTPVTDHLFKSYDSTKS